jgi:hypothetical protein
LAASLSVHRGKKRTSWLGMQVVRINADLLHFHSTPSASESSIGGFEDLIGTKVTATATATTPTMSKGHFIFNSIMRSSADVSLASHCGSLAIAAPPVLPSPTLASVSCGMVRRVFTARKRPVEFEVLYAPPPIRSWGGVGGSGHLIIRPAIPIQRSAMMGRLSEHRRSNGGGKNYYST